MWSVIFSPWPSLYRLSKYLWTTQTPDIVLVWVWVGFRVISRSNFNVCYSTTQCPSSLYLLTHQTNGPGRMKLYIYKVSSGMRWQNLGKCGKLAASVFHQHFSSVQKCAKYKVYERVCWSCRRGTHVCPHDSARPKSSLLLAMLGSVVLYSSTLGVRSCNLFLGFL